MSVSRTVLWDMNGTLIRSEELHWISWRDPMANEGIAISHEQFLASFGQRKDSILPRWLGAASTPERLDRIKRQRGTVSRAGSREWHLTGIRSCQLDARLHEQGWPQAIASAAILGQA
jgi:beta-phosphoglucomutase-like phosphatase (HAD superfamily)